MQQMSIERFLTLIGRYGSTIIFLVAIFFIYKALPDDVAIKFDSQNQAITYWSKGKVFYVAMGLMVSFNVVIIFTIKAIQQLPVAALPFHNDWQGKQQALQELYTNWLNGLIGIINCCIIAPIYALMMIGWTDTHSSIASYAYLGWVVVGILGSWLFYLVLRIWLR